MRMRGDRLRQIKCWITGGHVYNPLDKAVKYVRCRDEFVVWHECTKCGKVYYDTIPAEWIRRAMDRTRENAKTINFSTYIDTDNSKEEYDINVWNGQDLECFTHVDPEEIEAIAAARRKFDAQLRPLRDMDEIKHYMGEEPKEE